MILFFFRFGKSPLMSESFSCSFNQLIQKADSFRNEASGCLYEWVTESLTHTIHL